MIKKILFYVSAFFVSLIFSLDAYAAEKVSEENLEYGSMPASLMQLASVPVAFAADDYLNGYFDNNTDYSVVGNDAGKLLNNSLSDYVVLPIGTSNGYTFTFDNPVDFKSFYINAYNSDKNEKAYLKLDFYDVDDKKIDTYTTGYFYNSGNLVSYLEYPVKSVSKIVVSGVGTESHFREFEVFTQKIYLPVTNITQTVTDTTANFNWTVPNEVDHINFDGKDIGKSVTYLVKSLDPETEYIYTIDAVYPDGTVVSANVTIKTEKAKDTEPPDDVTNFNADSDKTSTVLSWTLPSNDDYYETWLYRDGALLKKFTDETSYTDTKLKEDTSYKYKLVTVDKEGNKSEGVTITVLTKHTITTTPPDAPKLDAKALSKGVRLSWNTPTSGTVKGYNIYMIDNNVASRSVFDSFVITAHAASTVQVNTSLISSNSYQISNLTNGNAYSFYIVAVNSSGLVSAPSNTVTVTPTAQAVPTSPVAGSYDLKDVADSTTHWFGSVWLILAFAIGIFLAFIIANRVKRLFFA